MTLKPDDYRHHFERFDLTRDQETAMIEALITIAETFADLAWGVHPSQHPEVANDNYFLPRAKVLEFPSNSTNNQNEERSAQARGRNVRTKRR